MNIHQKNKRKNSILAKGCFRYTCPIKGCKHDDIKLTDTKTLFTHLLEQHSDVEITRRFKLKKVAISNTQHGKQITMPHDVCFYVDNILNDTVVVDESADGLTDAEQVGEIILQMINTKTVFGLNHQSTINVDHGTTNIFLTSN